MPKVPHKDFGHVREFEGSLSTQLSKSEDENVYNDDDDDGDAQKLYQK
jgi:hypothetical protein